MKTILLVIIAVICTLLATVSTGTICISVQGILVTLVAGLIIAWLLLTEGIRGHGLENLLIAAAVIIIYIGYIVVKAIM